MALEQGEEGEDSQIGHLTSDETKSLVHEIAFLGIQQNLFVRVTFLHHIANDLIDRRKKICLLIFLFKNLLRSAFSISRFTTPLIWKHRYIRIKRLSHCQTNLEDPDPGCFDVVPILFRSNERDRSLDEIGADARNLVILKRKIKWMLPFIFSCSSALLKLYAAFF